MTYVRRTLWFFVGLMLSMVWGFSHAETIPAQSGEHVTPIGSLETAIKAVYPSSPGIGQYIGGGKFSALTAPGGSYAGSFPAPGSCGGSWTWDGFIVGCRYTSGYYCPSGANWTLSGSTCTRPDCVAPATRGTDGVCRVVCTAGASSGMSSFNGTGSTSPDSVCINGCKFPTGGICVAAGGFWSCGTAPGTGETCSANDTGSSTPPPKPAPCAAGEGVMTSTSGKVACVPPGTPGSETPKTGTKTSTKTNPDGSSTTTITNTTCTGAGACSSTTTTTTTGAGGGTGSGAAPGQAGTPGTTTETTDKTGDPNPETPDKPCDPKTSMCSSPTVDGLYTKKTETFAGPLSRFTAGLRSSVLGDSTSGFFNVTVPTGACPDWSASVQVLGGTFGVDMKPVFCSQAALNMMDVIGAVLMVVAAFGAFRWAIL